jgi:hypothetical protein
MLPLLAAALALGAPVPTEDAAATRAKVVAPVLDAQTYAVARVDLTKTDPEALLTTLGEFGVIDPADAKGLKTDAARWFTAFTKAGGKELYFVFSPTDRAKSHFTVVPLVDGADIPALAKLLNDTLAPPGPREKVGNLLVAGDKATLERLAKLKPADRPELAKAFAAAGDGAVQLAVIPPPQWATLVKTAAPILPKGLDEALTKPLTKGMTWAALGLDLSPKRAVRLTIQTADAEAARTLGTALAKAVQVVGAEQEGREVLPDLDKMAERLAPKVATDGVNLTLDDKDVSNALAPVLRRGLEAAAEARCINNLKQLTLAAHNYHDANGFLPPVAIADKAGKPLLSWRVYLLPYIEEGKLYNEFHLNEPWDSEHNKKLIPRMPAVFAGPSPWLNAAGKTVLLAPTGKNTCWPGGPKGLKLAQIPDGTSNTIFLLVADNAHAVEWSKPDDLKIDPAKPHEGLGRQAGRFLFTTADGAPHVIKLTITKETLRNAFDPADGNVLGNDW